jgi:dTDP-4-dehydrorhamnose 3,5-epimerase
MVLIPTCLEDCYQVSPFFAQDARGSFVKTFNTEQFSALGLPIDWREEYYSCSRKGVIRGMHFQTPPQDHYKLVYCIKGEVLDVVVDLRKGSSTFGKHFSVALDGKHFGGLIIPKGMAHGFLALSEEVLMAYKVTSVYSPENDAGLRWDSFGFDWGINQPIVSTRDQAHPALGDFDSPF